MKKIYSLSLLVALGTSSLYASNLKKIEDGETLAPIGSKTENSSKKTTEKEEPKKIPLVVHEVYYDKTLNDYSIIPHDKEGFKSYVAEKKVPAFTVKKLFGRADTTDATLLSAYGYDYNYGRPDLAENFYILLADKGLETRDKIKMADFYLRTGRPEKIGEVLTNKECIKSLNYRDYCQYYLGVKEYLETGNGKNSYFRLCQSKIEKAKELYNK